MQGSSEFTQDQVADVHNGCQFEMDPLIDSLPPSWGHLISQFVPWGHILKQAACIQVLGIVSAFRIAQANTEW